MEVLGLVGSPRKGGNTDILVDTILTTARNNGHEVKKVFLYDAGVGPCIDCRGCKKGKYVCIVEDGMQEIYPLMDAADAIVFGTPVYWCGPSGTMKQLVDRLRPYFANGLLRGKRALLAAPAKAGPTEGDLVTEMFRRAMKYLEVEFVGQVLGTAYDRKEILRDKKAMEKAVALGNLLEGQ